MVGVVRALAAARRAACEDLGAIIFARKIGGVERRCVEQKRLEQSTDSRGVSVGHVGRVACYMQSVLNVPRARVKRK